QPVKTYSSGMSVRVAFAAAIHIDPEILIVDEALAVGDSKFQHKCYARIEDFKARNKTIILVTHDVGQITAHCDRAILLNKGQLVMEGRPR
ncbi:ABC transporter ATP-binding protein, partial [Enterococcus faecalis]